MCNFLFPAGSVCGALLLLSTGSTFGVQAYTEAPGLAARVEAGELPPVNERLPVEPLVVELGSYGIHEIGHYGGILKFDAVDAPNVQGFTDITVPFFDDEKVTSVTGKEKFLPLTWKDYEVSPDFRVWTFYMRKGMRWSDGELYTTDDIRFWLDSVALNKELSPITPALLKIKGQMAQVEFLDTYSMRFTFPVPNLTFLSQIARLERDITGLPKHYLKDFHPDFTDSETLRARREEAGMDTWSQLFTARADRTQNSNPDLPSLLPWIVKDGIPASPVRYVRNPYYWAVDAEGQQLPYADEVRYTVVGNAERMKLRKVSGSVSVSPIMIDSAELVKRNAEKGKIGWNLLPPPGDLNGYTLCFNFLTPDPFKAKLNNDRRFRIAMSLQMPRDIISAVVDNGLTKPKQIGISDPNHPWYCERLATSYLEHDLEEANRLLDEVGLTERDRDGFRLNPDGNRITFSLQTVSHPQWTPVCEIIAEELPKVGLQANLRLVGWDGFSDTIRDGKWELFLGQDPTGYPSRWPTGMNTVRPSVWNSYEWQEWLSSDGEKGKEPPALMKECWNQWQNARAASSFEELGSAIQWLQNKAAEQLFAVGIVNFTPQLRVNATNVRNIPRDRGFFLTSALYIEDEGSDKVPGK